MKSMKNKMAINFLLALLVVAMIAACGGGAAPAATAPQTSAAAAQTTAAAAAAATTAASATTAAAAVTTAATTVAVTQESATTIVSTSNDILPDGVEALTLPVTTEDITLTYWCDMGKAVGAVENYSDILAFQKLQELTGVKIEFLHPAVGSTTEQFNLMIASRNLPDMIQYGWTGVPGGPGAYIRDEIIIPLNEPIGKWAPNLTKYLQDNDRIRMEQEMDDGTYYVFPKIYGEVANAVSQGPMLRNDWFPKLGIDEYPETHDDWAAMLRKAKETDLNGNGAGDAYPFFFAGKGMFDGCPMFLGSWGLRQQFYSEGGTIRFGAIQPEYREFLALLNAWHEEGLVDPESFTGTTQIQDEKFLSDKMFSTIGSLGANITRFTAMIQPRNEDFQLLPVAYPVLNKGDLQQEGAASSLFNAGGVAITTACTYVKEATKFLDYGYSEDGHILTNWGVEGITYEVLPDGSITYTELILNNPDGLSREQAMAKYTSWSFQTAVIIYTDVLNQRDYLPEQLAGRAEWLRYPNARLLPPLTATIDESREEAEILNEINTYHAEMFNQFVSGKTSLDEFDKFVDTLKSMKIDRAIELKQAQLERFEKRP